MSQIVTLSYYGVEGTGRNITAAKKAAGRKIEEAMSGGYVPEVVTWRGSAALVYREPSGWHYRIIATPAGVTAGLVYGCQCGTRKDATRAACFSLAQNGWQPEDGLTVAEIVTNQEDQQRLISWQRFQLRHRLAKQAGLDNNEAHSWATRDPSRWAELNAEMANVEVPAELA